MNLHPLEVNALRSDGLSHLDAISCAMLAIRRWQVHQIRPVLCQKRILCEVSAEAARRKDYWAVLLEVNAAFLIHAANNSVRAVREELVHVRLGNDARRRRVSLRYFLQHLYQSIGDR